MRSTARTLGKGDQLTRRTQGKAIRQRKENERNSKYDVN